jgi:parvulin-like peptidyl-prolyl isomerase
MAYKTDIPKSAEYKEELEKFKKSLAFQLWLRDFSKKITIDDKEVKKFYDTNKEKFKTPDQLKASHILVKNEKEAQEIITNLSKSKNLKEDFTTMAKEKSVGPSGVNGGELGWFTKEKMVPEFSEAAEKLTVGTITKTPVKTNYGFHIIYLDDKKASAILEYDKIKDRLKQDLMQEKFAKEAKEEALKLKKKAKIEYK